MKNYFRNLILIIVIECFLISIENNSYAQTIKPKSICEKQIQYGDIKICLPTIDGMTECYSLPIVKAKAEKFNFEGNPILGFYINNNTYAKVDKLNEISYDDYFQIYASNKLKGIKVGQAELSEIANMIEGSYVKDNWNDIKKTFENGLDNLSIDKPVLIESYVPNKKIRTFVMLVKYQTNNEETFMISTMNILQIKDRMIWLTYYKNYEGAESIKYAKAKNDYIVFQILDENK